MLVSIFNLIEQYSLRRSWDKNKKGSGQPASIYVYVRLWYE